MATLGEVTTAARELSFDRFVTPCLFIGGKEGQVIDITDTELIITDNAGASPVVLTQLDFATYDTIEKITNALIVDTNKYSISYAASYIALELSTSLLTLTASPIFEPIAIYRKNFFGDQKIEDLIERYFQMILGVSCEDAETADLEEEIALMTCQRPDHMACWIAYWLVDQRRLFEMAGEMLGQSTASFTGKNGLIGVQEESSDIRVSIGDVFTLNSPAINQYNRGEEPWRVGADNVLGDANSFWYRLLLWLRDKIEQLYKDYSLRKDNIMVGVIDLQRDTNFYAFYDSYPYTISPLSREILSSFETY